MRVYWEILYPLSDLNEFGTRVRLKPSNDQREFELDQAKSKNNIGENSVALGHETHNILFINPFNLIAHCRESTFCISSSSDQDKTSTVSNVQLQ